MILLINPPAYDFKAFDTWLSPYGLLSMASALKKKGHEIKLFDFLDRLHPGIKNSFILNSMGFGRGKFYQEEIDRPEIYKNVPRKYKKYGLPWEIFERELHSMPQPEAVLITTLFTYWYPGALKTIEKVRAAFPKSKILLGGIYPLLCRDHAIKHSGADIVVSERSLKKAVSVIDEILPRAENPPASDFPIPDYSLYDEQTHAAVMLSAGCPFACSYCATPLIEKKMRWADTDEVFGLVSHLYKEKGVLDFAFYDDALLYRTEEHLLPFLDKILRSGIKPRFHAPNALHCRYLTEEIAGYLYRTGFQTIRLGLESADPKMKEILGGKVDEDEFAAAVNSLKKAGFTTGQTGVYLLAGIPGVSFSSIEHSIRTVHKAGIKSFIAQFSPIPGTAAGDELLKEKIPGYSEDFDPLYTNNTYWWYKPEIYNELENLRLLSLRLNAELEK
ncbi:MAG: radical SAM protein [Chloroflexi bacterium]|nr:radical SAM protein [Chloroflexota bacterium]